MIAPRRSRSGLTATIALRCDWCQIVYTIDRVAMNPVPPGWGYIATIAQRPPRLPSVCTEGASGQ